MRFVFSNVQRHLMPSDSATISSMRVPPQAWLDPRLVVAPSPIHGLGLFASGRIRSGEVVMVLGGETVSDIDVRDLIARGERYDGIVLDEDVNLLIKPRDWPGIRGNHSCDPNLWLTPPVDIAAKRDIEAGEEVDTDYGTYTMASDWQMVCLCGSTLCRGTVSGDDWQRPELQDRYSGHFAYPITRRIALEMPL
jgi:hypothetical protein